MLWVQIPPSVLDFISKHIRDWSNGKTRASKPFDVGSIPTSRASPGNSVEECFATNEEDGGSNPSQGARHFSECPLRLHFQPKVGYDS
jgi:hypothetical protein